MLRSVLATIIVACGCLSSSQAAEDPPLIPLWEKWAPGFENRKDEKEVRDRVNKVTDEYRTTNIHNTYITAFLPPNEKAKGQRY